MRRSRRRLAARVGLRAGTTMRRIRVCGGAVSMPLSVVDGATLNGESLNGSRELVEGCPSVDGGEFT
jgi:hypothetical protein